MKPAKGLDFRKFKKVASDEKTSTLRHEDGHELKIAHASLTPELKKQLASIPVQKEKKTQNFDDGGSVQIDPAALTGVPSYGQQQAPQQPIQIQPQQEAPDPYMSAMQNATKQQIGALGEQEKGQSQMLAAQGQLGQQQARSIGQYQQQANDVFNDFDQKNRDLLAEREALQSDVANGHVDPNKYIDNMSTGKEIRTGLGLILGGMGAGLTHGPNLAFQYLQNQIDRDIDAQKVELGKRQNLLSNNLAQTQDLRAATDLTRLHTNDILSSSLQMEAAKMQDPVKQGEILNVKGMLDGQSAQLQQKLAMQQALMGGGSGQDPEAAFQKRMQFLRVNGQDQIAKDMEAKHVPGVGQASREVPPDVIKEMSARQDLANKIQDLQQFASQNSGSLDPAIINQGAAKSRLVQDAYRSAAGQGVFREAEKKFVDSIAGDDPTQFFEKYRSGQGYSELGKANLDTLNSIKKGYGLPQAQMPKQAQQPQIQTMKGVPYTQGPDGNWHRVK